MRHCGSKKLERALSKFAVPPGRTADVLRDYGAEPKRLEDYKDPRQIGRWAERKFDEFGMEMPKEARKMIDAAREGEFPDPVKDCNTVRPERELSEPTVPRRSQIGREAEPYDAR